MHKNYFFTCNFPNFRTEVCINLVFHTISNKIIRSWIASFAWNPKPWFRFFPSRHKFKIYFRSQRTQHGRSGSFWGNFATWNRELICRYFPGRSWIIFYCALFCIFYLCNAHRKNNLKHKKIRPSAYRYLEIFHYSIKRLFIFFTFRRENIKCLALLLAPLFLFHTC